MGRRLTLVAGAGSLVPHILAAAQKAGDEVQVLMVVQRDDLPGAKFIPNMDMRAIMVATKAFGSTHVTMAGAVQLSDNERKGISASFDASHGGAVGDTQLSSSARVITEKTGAILLGAHQLAPDLVAAAGRLGGPTVDEAIMARALFALRKARATGALDLGQAVVVSGSRVIAAEDIGGTDELMLRTGRYRDEGLTSEFLILAKAAKPDQPDYIDLPAIGPDTVAKALQVRIALIAVEAGKTLVLERGRMRAAADAAGISVVALTIPQ
jgi:UDP-2,3-diacylglucosamine hydrolase